LADIVDADKRSRAVMQDESTAGGGAAQIQMTCTLGWRDPITNTPSDVTLKEATGLLTARGDGQKRRQKVAHDLRAAIR
jgi:hypothetical protein